MFYKIINAILLSAVVTYAVQIKDVPEDGTLNFTGLALKYRGAVEEYDVRTEDGYILKLFRIPSKKSTPILLIHGLLASSDDFILRGNDSLAVSLAQAGYDLWLLNYRGNRYSRRHSTINPDTNSSFWEFGPHEHGYYDLASCIDTVLKNTGEKKLSLIGHSEGCMITYILAAEKPEYNEKIQVFIALAPIMYLHKVRAKFRKINEFGYVARQVLRHFRINEVGGYDGINGALTRSICAHTIVGMEVCRRLIFLTSGYDAEGLESEFIPTLFSHYPAGTSRKNLEHSLQIVTTKRFANFDYGPVRNMEVYKSKAAPYYDIKKVTMPIYLIAAKNDQLSVLEDTKLQARDLPNVKGHLVVEYAFFNHIDYLWSRQSKEFVHPKIMDILRTYN